MLTMLTMQAAAQPRAFEIRASSDMALCDAYARFRSQADQTSGFAPPDLGRRHVGYEDEWQLLTRVEDFLWTRDVNPAENVTLTQVPTWDGNPEQLTEARRGFHERFSRAIDGFGYYTPRIDVDNDGEAETVFFARTQTSATLLVLTDDAGDVDVEKTERLLKHPSRKQGGWGDVRAAWPDERRTYDQEIMPVTDAYLFARYEIWSRQQIVYVSFSWFVHPEFSITDWSQRKTEHVYLTTASESIEVCEIRYLIQ
jgi:hypothetical protein